MDAFRQLEIKPKKGRPPPSLQSVHRRTDSINHMGIWNQTFLFTFLFPFIFTYLFSPSSLLCSLAIWLCLCNSH